MSEPKIYGWTIKTFLDPDRHPEMKTAMRLQAEIMFIEKWGFEPTDFAWYHESAYLWEDEETGEVVTVPDQWMLTAEGAR